PERACRARPGTAGPPSRADSVDVLARRARFCRLRGFRGPGRHRWRLPAQRRPAGRRAGPGRRGHLPVALVQLRAGHRAVPDGGRLLAPPVSRGDDGRAAARGSSGGGARAELVADPAGPRPPGRYAAVSGALDHAAAARSLRSARRAGRTLDVPLSRSPGLSLADAYRIQDQMTALRLADGERLAGWKLGYTSAVMRAQMGIEAPNFGPLTDAMLLGSPAVLPAGALQPRVEPEIGLRLGRPLRAPCSADDVLAACDAALACLEIVDSVWSGYRFTLEDNTADGSSAAAGLRPGGADGDAVGGWLGRGARCWRRGERAPGPGSGVAGGAARRARAGARARGPGHHRRPDQRAPALARAQYQCVLRRRPLARRGAQGRQLTFHVTPAEGEYEHRVPNRRDPRRCAASSGWTGPILDNASRTRALTVFRARSASSPSLRSR